MKSQAIKFILILIASTVVAVLLHQVHHDPLMTLGTKARSVVITSGYFPPVAFASLAAAFGVVGVMFVALQKCLPGTRLRKGAVFGVALGGMYLVGMLEAYVVYPVPLFGEIYTGMVDGGGILLISLLLGKYLADDAAGGEAAASPVFPAILIIPLSYVLVRYFSYTVLQIESSFFARPLATFLWTAGMGCWGAVMYLLVGRHIGRGGPFRQALLFGGIVFGINWLVFNLFALLFISVPVSDLVYRSLFDALAIVAGVYITSLLSRKPMTPQGAL